MGGLSPVGGQPGLHAFTTGQTLRRSWSRRRSIDEIRSKETGPSLRHLASLLLCPTALYAILRAALGVAHQTCLVISIAVTYIGFTESVRLHWYKANNRELHLKVRELIEARRAAGLQRLGAEVATRQLNWPRPPYSYTATVLGRFDTDRVTPLQDREVDYRSLACDAISKVLDLISSIEANQGPSKVSAVHSWVLQRLMHEGPSPEKDSEMFQELHKAIDIAEHQGDNRGYYCRLCLGYQTSGLSRSFRIRMSCGKSLCSRCAKELVEGVIEGRVRLPLACPTGNCNAVLTPSLVQHLLKDEDYDRFKRMHDVKMSLDRSAPHKDGLAARLAEARRLGSAQGAAPCGPSKGTTLTTVHERTESRDRSPSVDSKLLESPDGSSARRDFSGALNLEHISSGSDGRSSGLVGMQNLTIRSSPTKARGFRLSGAGEQPGDTSTLLCATKSSPLGTPTTSSPLANNTTPFSNLLQPLMADGNSAKKHSD